MASSTDRARPPRGFTLIEMLIALAIGSFGMAAAAYVAQVAVRQGGRGQEQNQLGSSSQVVGRQLRNDLELAGHGTTGGAGIDPGDPGLLSVAVATPAGWSAIPVVRLLNNLPATPIAGVTSLNNSDVLQLIVPNPSTALPLAVPLRRGSPANAITNLANYNAPALPNCAPNPVLLLIADYGATTGAARSQIVDPAAGSTLQFDVSQGSSVMCVRISTYWVDQSFALRRSEYQPGISAVLNAGGVNVFVPAATNSSEIVAMGALDFQVALRLSAEVFGPLATADASWALTAPANAAADAALATQTNWFEIRQVRFSIPLRAARSVDEPGQTMLSAADELEDHPPGTMIADLQALDPNAVGRGFAMIRISSSQVLYNLRFFDQNLPALTPAEPY